MRLFNRRRTAALLIFAAGTATVGGSAHAVLNNINVNVSDVIETVDISILSDLLNGLHLLSCDQGNLLLNDGEANEQGNTQTNRCSISVLKVKDVLNDLGIDGLLSGGLNVLTEGN